MTSEVCAANGSSTAVAQSGTSIMSESLIAFQPAIDEPSNITPSLRKSSVIVRTWCARCCHLPRGSVKRKSTNLTSCSLIISRTLSVSDIARFRSKIDRTLEHNRQRLLGHPFRRQQKASCGACQAFPDNFAGPERVRLDRVRSALAGADTDCFVDCRDKDFAVADPAGMGSLLDRLDRALDQRFLHHNLDFHLRQKVDHVFCPAIEFGMALLAAETLGLGDGDALNADLVKRLLHLVELEGLDDRLDLFHRILISLNPKQRPRSSAKHILCHSFPRREMERLFPRSAQF